MTYNMVASDIEVSYILENVNISFNFLQQLYNRKIREPKKGNGTREGTLW